MNKTKSFTENEINNIAQSLDCGLNCYINTDTWERKEIIDLNESYGDDELFREELAELEQNWENYIIIEKMSSREGFEVMESFLTKVTSAKRKNRLINALNRKHPFRNFKHEVDSHEETRQQWFKHKNKEYEDHVKFDLTHKLAAKKIELVVIPEINFNDKTFRLLNNSTNGIANKETVFKYKQVDDLVSGDYFDGTIYLGRILGIVEGATLNIVYQCVTAEKELKAGKAKAQISFTEKGKMKLNVNWQWLNGDQSKGTSEYIETNE